MTVDATRRWLSTPLGRAVLASESLALKQALAQVFGLNLLQIGCWGEPQQFLQHARIGRRALIAPELAAGVAAQCRPTRLAIASDSIDAVILPHTLEIDPDPHTVLREADRILVGEGHLIVLGFNPWSAWGLRRTLTRGRFPVGARRLVSERRLRDWLSVLGMEVREAARCVYTPPVNHESLQRRLANIDCWAAAYLSRLSGAYILVAQKRVYSVTPLRPQWSRKPRVAAGRLVEPTTRSAA